MCTPACFAGLSLSDPRQTALGVTQQHQRLAVLLRESVRRRLLHPGANTHQIIDVYIATIKVLRILDPKVP